MHGHRRSDQRARALIAFDVRPVDRQRHSDGCGVESGQLAAGRSSTHAAEVIGVNTAIIRSLKASVSPSALIRRSFIAGRLIKRWEKSVAGFLGISGQNVELPRRVVRFHDLHTESGFSSWRSRPRSPAQRASLAEGDVIIGYGDQTVRDIDDLHRLLVEEKVGIPMALTFLRRGEKRTISVIAEESRVQDRMSAP